MNLINILTFVAMLNHVPYGIMYGVGMAESNLTTNAYVHHDGKDGKDAIGIFQLHLATARSMGFTGKKKELFDPTINSYYASKYLAYLYKREGSWKLALAAYNAGPYAVDKYHGIPPYPKTKAYVRRVLRTARKVDEKCTL